MNKLKEIDQRLAMALTKYLGRLVLPPLEDDRGYIRFTKQPDGSFITKNKKFIARRGRDHLF